MSISVYALVSTKTNIVENTIVADSSFLVEGYYLIEISQEKPASVGMTYSKESNQFNDAI